MIEEIEVQESPSGEILVCYFDDGQECAGQSIPISAVANYAERLGLDNAVAALEAVSQIGLTGSPIDPVTGESAWTEIQEVKAHLETVREAEAAKAVEEGTADDPRSPALRSALAVQQERKKLAEATGGDECLLQKCQRRARQILGVPDPDCSVSSVRGGRLRCDTEDCKGDWYTQEDREKAKACLEPLLGKLERQREILCHSLTGSQVDPLGVAPPPQRAPGFGDITQRYRQEEAP